MKPAVEELKDVIVPVLRDYGVVRAGVFGSRSRTDYRPDSDLDLLVEFKEGTSLLDLVGLELELTERLGIRTQVVTYRSLHPLLRDRILSDEVPLL